MTESKVSGPNSYFNWTCIFEWCVVRYGSKNGHEEEICSEEIGLHARNS